MIMVVCIVSGVAVIAVNQSSGNDVNGQYFRHYSRFFHPLLTCFLIKGVLKSKNLFSESGTERPIT